MKKLGFVVLAAVLLVGCDEQAEVRKRCSSYTVLGGAPANLCVQAWNARNNKPMHKGELDSRALENFFGGI